MRKPCPATPACLDESCTTCARRKYSREYASAWRALNREHHRQYARNLYQAAPERGRRHCKAYYKKNKDKVTARARANRTGHAEDYFNARIVEQKSKCAIEACLKTLPPSGNGRNADHCHSSGKPRGVLCIRCNMAMGIIDRPELTQSLMKYRMKWLEQHK